MIRSDVIFPLRLIISQMNISSHSRRVVGNMYLKLTDQILPNVIPWGHQVFAPSLAPVPASGSTTMDIFNSLSSQAGSDMFIKNSSITVPVAVEGLMKDVFTYLSSSQASSDVLAKPTDNMQIDNDQHIACSPPPLLQSAATQANESALLLRSLRLLPSQVARPPCRLQPSHCCCQACPHFLASTVHQNPSSPLHSQM